MQNKIILIAMSLILVYSKLEAQIQSNNTVLGETIKVQNLTEHELILSREKTKSFSLQTQTVTEKSNLMPPNPSCTNMDFEAGNISGWLIESGSSASINYACTLLGCCSGTNTSYSIVSNGHLDGYFPATPINSQFGFSGNGNKFLKLSDSIGMYKVQKLSQSFSVTPSNALFRFAYKFIGYDGGHNCCEQAFLNIRFKDHLGNIVPTALPNFSITPPGICPSAPGTTVGITSSTVSSLVWIKSTPWIFSSADLSSYIGKSVSFELIVGGCNSGGHFGYTYFDAMCSSLTYSLNSNSNQLDSMNTVCVNTFPATLSAPNGFQNYVWTTSTGTISGQNLNVTSTGSYTLALSSTGACCPTFKVFNVSLCTGITSIPTKSGNMFLFPNPAKTEITLVNTIPQSEIRLFDLIGNVVSSTTAVSEKTKIDISELSDGVYFIKIYTAGESVKTFKFIKQ